MGYIRLEDKKIDEMALDSFNIWLGRQGDDIDVPIFYQNYKSSKEDWENCYDDNFKHLWRDIVCKILNEIGELEIYPEKC